MSEMDSVKVRFSNVGQRFRIIHNRPATLRQAFASLFYNRSYVQKFEALKEVSFQVHGGETFGIIGRNGSGKSTILKIAARIFPPSSGKVEVNGQVSALIELGAGFHPELTGRENIILGGALMGLDPAKMEEKVPAIIAFAELEEFLDVPVKQYSSGMFARLGFAVATEIDPAILLVDEILAVGDEPFQHKCLERMNRFRRRGKTIVFVSHDLNAIQSHCTRVLLLDHGQVVAIGPPKEIVDRYHQLLQHPTPNPASI